MKQKSIHALFTGSFDPVTLGHEDIIRRAAALFDTVTVGVFVNHEKQGLFTPEERVSLLQRVCAPYPNVRVCHDEGMVADFVTRNQIDVIVRSIRNEADLDYERKMAAFNKERCEKETIFLTASDTLGHVSSSLVRAKLAGKEGIADLVPPLILEDVLKKHKLLQKKANKD